MTEEEHFCSAAVGEEELADGLEQIAAMGRHALAKKIAAFHGVEYHDGEG